ncbi:MAG: hypothetical protein ACI976_003118, partial [Aureispira sp.]
SFWSENFKKIGRVTRYTTHFLKLSSSKIFNNTCSLYLFLVPKKKK